ncbi:MAG: toll/interleukin-1 receptor domain-containing protein [Acidobacteriota bacterium]|nr:toll/interleukin-1 receptor domain-containing protein [Acidobacteriota bacterium]
MSTHQIFISYAHSDAEWAQKFAENLEQLGLSVWLDRKISPGQSWVDEVEAGMRESDIFAFLIQPEKINSPSFSFELGAAMSLGKILIPVVPPGLKNHLLPSPLRRIQWLERTSPEETARKFAQAVEVLSAQAA